MNDSGWQEMITLDCAYRLFLQYCGILQLLRARTRPTFAQYCDGLRKEGYRIY